MSMEIRKEQELATSRDYEGNPTGQTITYLVHGAESEETAFALVQTTAATYIGNLKLKTYELNEVKGGGAFTFDVNYVKSESGGLDGTGAQEPQYSCGIGHASAKMIRHLGEVWKSEGAESLPGINLTEDGYQGVDIAKANPQEDLTITVRKSKVTTDYKRLLMEMAFTVNEKKFKGWEPGEVLFTGAHISRSGDEDYRITYNFLISPNEKDIDFMGINIPEKKGWDYAWAIQKQTITDNKKVIPVAESVYVHKVYERSDFVKLGIGT